MGTTFAFGRIAKQIVQKKVERVKKAFQDGELDKGDGRRLPPGDKGFHYLFSRQNSDGGWGGSKNDASTILLTAIALISLKQCPETPEKVVAVNKAAEYILSGRHEDGGFGDKASTVRETALVYSALHGTLDAPDVLELAREFILSAQSDNGSWNDDLYSTVLAIEAAGLFTDTASVPGKGSLSTPDQDTCTGVSQTVQDKSLPISGAQVTMRDTWASSDAEEPPAAANAGIRERIQHTKISLVSRRNASASAAAELPDFPAGKGVTVRSVNTDKKKYLSHETVCIYSTIENEADDSRSIVVNAQIADSHGHIVDAATHDTSPSVNLGAGSCEPVTLSWYTGMNPPGSYSVRFHVADAADGRILDETKITFSISSASPAIVTEYSSFSDERVANKVSLPIFNQDGYGFSGTISPKPLPGKTVMTGYSQWPAGFRKGNLAFTGAVFDGEFIWMVPANADSIVKIDKDTGEMTAFGEWPAGFRKGNLAFTGAVFDGEFIWMVPANADSVIKIDRKNGKMASYNDWPEGFSKGGHAFAGGVFDGRYVWMIPANADSVVTLDTLTGEMKRCNAWPEGHAMVEYAFAGGVFDGRYVWMIPYYSEQVVRVDTQSGEMTGCHRRPEDKGKVEYAFAGAAFDGQAIWMVPLNADQVIKIDKDTSEAAGLDNWPQGFRKGVNAFAGGVFDGDCIWMIPSYADRVLRIFPYSSMSVSANKDNSTDDPMAKKLEATIMAQPSPVYEGLSETIYYKISSTHGDDLAGIQVEVAILTSDLREMKQSFIPRGSQAKDGSYSGTFTFSTGTLQPGHYLACLLVSSDGKAVPREIASTQFTVRRIDVVIT